MKLMLMADLHLGKKVNEFSMLEDQAYLLDQVIGLIDEHRPDGLIIAGDVYDKSSPSAEAVRLLDVFIRRIKQRDICLFMIAGNHDSADRLSFGASIFSDSDIYIAEAFRRPIEPIEWQAGGVMAHIYLLPFIKPIQVRAVWPESDVSGYDEALKYVLGQIELAPNRFNLLVAHQFISGAKTFDSDDILIGGIDQVSAAHFESFDYTVLGHLHGPQTVGSEHIRYPGSPLKYSFSEAAHQKSIPLIEIDPDHRIETTLLGLKPLRDMRIIRGPFQLITDPKHYRAADQHDYVQITLTDELEVADAIAWLRAIYPNLMKLSYDNKRTQGSDGYRVAEAIHHRSPLELFEDFYQSQNNHQPMSDEQKDYVEALLREMEEDR